MASSVGSLGIIGYGSFGRFLSEFLGGRSQVKVYDPKYPDNPFAAPLEEVARCNLVFLAIPLSAYDDVLPKLRGILPVHTTIVDVCSVKVQAIEKLNQHLPDQPKLLSHPLFGPESAANKDKTVVICPDGSSQAILDIVEWLMGKMGLKIVYMSPEEHDRQMSVVQGLTFFVARALHEFGIHEQTLSTPSFRRLLHLAELESHHSDELFTTIQLGNQYNEQMRERFVALVDGLNSSLNEQSVK